MKTVQLNATTPDYFRVAGIRLLQGRTYRADTRASAVGASDEVMINESFARRFWPDGRAVGAQVRYGDVTATIVGVVNDVTLPGPGARRGSGLQLYVMFPGAPFSASLIVRSRLPLQRLESLVRNTVQRGSSLVMAGPLEPAEGQLVAAMRRPMLIARLLGGFAAIALLLAAIGLHAVIAYAVKQREREIGIRIALGAPHDAIARLVFSQGIGLTLVGVAAGVGASLYVTRAMRVMLFGVEPGDPATVISSVALLVVVAMVACAAPAWRATRVDPAELVRTE
jgi:hypothetical protein